MPRPCARVQNAWILKLEEEKCMPGCFQKETCPNWEGLQEERRDTHINDNINMTTHGRWRQWEGKGEGGRQDPGSRVGRGYNADI